MINIKLNKDINKKLSELYTENTSEFLSVYKKAFKDTQAPDRINEFGIIDEECYDAEKGILVIAKETHGWNNNDFEQGLLFRDWLSNISKNGAIGNGHIEKHPTMWYNIGRWLLTINNPTMSVEHISELKQETITELKTMAYTNINKVRGKGQSGTEYEKVAYSDIAGVVLREEISIIKPKVIICCGTWRPFCYHLNYEELESQGCKILCMPHPTCRRNKVEMLKDLRSQIENDG